MKAMLLAAGLGERMRPLTRLIPKPAIPVLGRPIAVQILQRLAKQGVTQAVVNLHRFPDQIRSLLGDGSALGLEKIHYSYEASIRGTGGGIGKAAPELRGDKCILVHNADFLSDIDVNELISNHMASGCPVTLVLAAGRPGYTPIEVDGEGRVLSIGGRPKAAERYMFTGCHILNEEVLDLIPAGRPSDIVEDVYLDLIMQGKVTSQVHSGFWWEFGSPDDLLEGSLRLLDLPAQHAGRIAHTDPVYDVDDATAAVGAGADFHSGVSLRGRVALGFACTVAEGTVLEDSIVMPEACIGPGSHLRRVIVAPAAEVPAGFELESALVCMDTDPDAEPDPGTQRREGLLIRNLDQTPRT